MTEIARVADKKVEFLARLAPFSESERTLINRALNIAEKAHRGQFRLLNHEPYFTHPLAAASILLDAGIRNSDMICGALLHDVAEDTPYFEDYPILDHSKHNRMHPPMAYGEYIKKVRETLATEGFSKTTADIVVALTKPAIIDEEKDGIVADGVDFFNYDQAYAKKNQLLWQAEKDGFWEAILVKMADRIHNLGTFFPKPGKDTPWPKIQETFDILDIFIKAPTKSSYPVPAAKLSTEMSRKMAQSMYRFPRRPRLDF
jgi:(p)ppGpp synthase/HD superfamily hydrolase